jgi:pimeloyl-ACP methyl ester carboxylesterase
MKEAIFDFHGRKIRYRKFGKGPCVVLLHGFTESIDIWDDYANELSAGWQVVSVELPGHGKSECLGEVHSMELMADMVRELVIGMGISRYALVGHSMGGYVCLAMAERYADEVSGLCLFHSSALADTEEAKVRRDKVIEFVKNDHSSFLAGFIPDLFAPDNRKVYQKEIEKLVAAARPMTGISLAASLAGMRDRPDRRHVLSSAKFPLLFMIGKLDTRVDHAQAMLQAALPDDAVVVSMGGVGHMGYIEARDRCLYALQVFLKGL